MSKLSVIEHSDLAQRLLALATLFPQTSGAATVIQGIIAATSQGVKPATTTIGLPNLDAPDPAKSAAAVEAAMQAIPAITATAATAAPETPPIGLSPHFSYAEMIASQTAGRLNISNTPNAIQLARLRNTAAQMETVRTILGGRPIHIDSGFRSANLNAALPSASKTSAHMDGDAVDFICPGFGEPWDIVTVLKNCDIRFDQMILESTWVHISFAPAMRQQMLTIDSIGTRDGFFKTMAR